ncbi:MAG: PepSY domain-containing protein [Siphonobacter aquaeclarae]|nr:PepSY domain-containing protein [Siphonobacter aquaeclarae]
MLKKAILLTHRYLGVVLCLLFVIWFLSGFVMMYVPFPTMKHQERLGKLPEADFRNCRVTLREAWQQTGWKASLKTARLGMMLGRPVYRLVSQNNEHALIRADTPERIGAIDIPTATRLAQEFHPATIRHIEELTQIDQWMAGHKYQGYLPHVYRFEMTDGMYVYVAVHSGEVVQYVTQRQRILAWLGPIPHWIYPTILIRNRPIWSQVVIWVSIAGSVMSLSGILMGIIRVKRRRKAPILAISPYKKRWFRWHHYTGFVFGLFVFTWVLSGLFSMSPFGWAPSTKLTAKEAEAWSGGSPETADWKLPPTSIGSLPGFRLKEIHFQVLHGRPYYLAWEDEHRTRLLPADSLTTGSIQVLPTRPEQQALARLRPGATVRETALLTAYDDYYYSKRGEKRLPVLRVTFADPDETAYYVDLHTGQVVLRHQSATRLERWLYHGLHSFDFRWLVYRRPLWDIVVGVLMTGGLAVSVTGLVLGYRWLRRKIKNSLT